MRRPEPRLGAPRGTAATGVPDRSLSGRVRLLGLAGFVVVVAAVALAGSLAVTTGPAYDRLARPGWAPPAWLFGPVWTVLYATIAVAGWLVWCRVGFGWALVPWVVQLGLNGVWTPIFFGAAAYGLAVAEIVVLWCAIGATVATFRRVRPAAAVLLLPYWAWVTFATALTIAIWRANP